MSETPSNYDLVQDARIGPMEQILSQAAEPPNATSYSYPVVGQGWSTEMWRRINRNVGNGILAEGGNPFWLRGITNASNTARVTVSTITGEAAAVMHGFYFAMVADETVALPMPSSGAVTYHICLTYDPRNEKNAEGPISLQVYNGVPPTTFAREHIILWKVARSANQLLTDATVTRVRPFVGGVVSVNSFDELPNAGEILFGTIGVVRNDKALYYAYTPIESGSNDGEPYWALLTDPEWIDRVNSTYRWGNIGEHPGSARVGNQVFLRGVVATNWDGNFNTNQNDGDGYWVMSLPTNQHPSRVRYFTCAVAGATGQLGFARVEINNSGEVRARVSKECSWVSLDGIQFHTK